MRCSNVTVRVGSSMSGLVCYAGGGMSGDTVSCGTMAALCGLTLNKAAGSASRALNGPMPSLHASKVVAKSALRSGFAGVCGAGRGTVGISGAPDHRRKKPRSKSHVTEQDDAEGGDEGAKEDE